MALGPNAQMVGLPLDIIQLSKYLRKAVQLGSVWFNIIIIIFFLLIMQIVVEKL